MRRILRRTAEERGIALVLALLIMAALAAGLTTAIVVSSSSGRTSTRATADQLAYNAAEAGINLAMSSLHASNTNALNVDALPTTTTNFPIGCTSDCTGRVTWGGVLNTTTSTWTITSTGYSRNTASPNLPDRWRKLTATSYVQPDLSQDVNNQVWNYIYAFGTNTATSCDVNIDNNVHVYAPVYAEGNLCLQSNATIDGKTSNPPTPVSVVVKGRTAFYNSASGIGPNQQVVEAHLANGCGGSGFSNLHTCNPNSPVRDNIHAGTFDTSPTSVQVPYPDFNNYYSQANPGPMHPCETTTKLNAPVFDSDTNLNLATNGNAPSNSGAPTANTLWLTPDSYDYTCKGFAQDGTLVGQLSWDHLARKLSVSGVIYFDGNIYISGTSYYVGQATLYITGAMNLYGRMCGGTVSNGDCVYNPGQAGGWNPNTTMLIVVAHGMDATGDSVDFSNANGAHWQGGLFSQNSLTFKNNAVVEGPIISKFLHFTNNVSAVPFPVIDTVPLGAPGNPNVYANAQPPVVSG